MARRLLNFIDGFSEFARAYNTTEPYMKAGAIWMIGSTVGRAVGMKTGGNDTFPNLFMQLVGGPGTGKSQIVGAIRRVMVQATGASFIPASVTRAGLEDYMKANLQNRKSPDGTLLLSNECLGLSDEMQGILPEHDIGHLTLYNLLYDLPNVYKAVTRSNGEVKLEAPYCSILTGAQPAFLATTMPEQAWGMGFMSRSIMIFSQPAARRSIFSNQQMDMKLLADLTHDLKVISKLNGWMSWTPEAIALYEEWWVEQGGIPIPTAKRLIMGYNARRPMHFLKFAMIYSLARSDDLIVELEDAVNAISTLLEFESRMTHIFAEMSQTGAMIAIQDILDVVKLRTAEGKVVEEAEIIDMLMQRFPSTQVHATIENLINSRAIELVPGTVNARGMRKFKLGGKAGALV